MCVVPGKIKSLWNILKVTDIFKIVHFIVSNYIPLDSLGQETYPLNPYMPIPTVYEKQPFYHSPFTKNQ